MSKMSHNNGTTNTLAPPAANDSSCCLPVAVSWVAAALLPHMADTTRSPQDLLIQPVPMEQ